MGREIYTLKRYEERYANFLTKEISESDICIDVGGNIGFYSMLMACKCKEGEVHSFEPIPLNAKLIEANACLNSMGNIHVNQLALGEKSCELSFLLASDSAYSSAKFNNQNSTHNRISVKQITLDQYIESRGIKNVDIMKVDVEGGEFGVLQGAQRLLSSDFGPRLIMLELFDDYLKAHGSSAHAVLSMLMNFGYQPFYPGDDGQLMPFQSKDINKVYNVIFIKQIS